VLRPVGRALTDIEANNLRDRVYTALQQGSVMQRAIQPARSVGTPP
jgi:hypothetical protein